MKIRIVGMKAFTRLAIALLLSVALSTSAHAFSWNLYDYGVGPFDYNNNWSPIDYPYGIGHLPSPGYISEGGEKFDLEGFHAAISGSTLFMSMTSSFVDSVYSTGWKTWYRQGDIFINVDGGDWDYALDVSANQLVRVDSWNYITDKTGSYYDDALIRDAAGAFEVASGTSLTGAAYVHTYYAGLETNPLAPSTYQGTHVMEWGVDLSGLSAGDIAALSGGTLQFHATLECGNDLIEQGMNPIPEPGTLMLLGLGMAGLAFRLRRRT